jgi:hypothetical protein
MVGYRLSGVGYRLSVIGCRLSVVCYQLSVVDSLTIVGSEDLLLTLLYFFFQNPEQLISVMLSPISKILNHIS